MNVHEDPAIAQAAKQHVLERYPKQSMGGVVDGKYVPMEKLYEIEVPVLQAVIQSRKSKSTAPSRMDMVNQQAMSIPWAIFHCSSLVVLPLQWKMDGLLVPCAGRVSSTVRHRAGERPTKRRLVPGRDA